MDGFEKCQDVTIFFISITLLFWIGQCGMNYRVHNFAISNIALSHDITSRISQKKILLLYFNTCLWIWIYRHFFIVHDNVVKVLMTYVVANDCATMLKTLKKYQNDPLERLKINLGHVWHDFAFCRIIFEWSHFTFCS